MPKPAQNVTDKYLEVFMPLPQKYSISLPERKDGCFELYCNEQFVYGNANIDQIFIIYNRLLDGILPCSCCS
jgi:hypothetical protein